MATQSTLHRQLQSAKELQSIVRTMKALAAGNIHQYEEAVRSLSTFNRTLKEGLQIFLMHYPERLQSNGAPPDGRLGIVVFGSDQGMCGRFNEQLGEYVMRHLSHSPLAAEGHQLLAVGSRIADYLAQAGQVPHRRLPVPSALGKVSHHAQTIVLQLESWRQEHQVDRIWIFHNHPHRGLSVPKLAQLFPFDPVLLKQLKAEPWPSRSLPVVFQDRTPLFSALFQQFFFTGLYLACVESIASENAHRLASMQMAEKNIQDRLEQLHRQYQQQRQSTITSELLDIVSGFEVLKSD